VGKGAVMLAGGLEWCAMGVDVKMGADVKMGVDAAGMGAESGAELASRQLLSHPLSWPLPSTGKGDKVLACDPLCSCGE